MDEQAAVATTTTTTTTEETLLPISPPSPSFPMTDPVLAILQGEMTGLREQIEALKTQLQSEANQELQNQLEAMQTQMTEMNHRLSSMQTVSPEPELEVETEPEAELIVLPNADATQSPATGEMEERNAKGAGIGEMLVTLLFGKKKTAQR